MRQYRHALTVAAFLLFAVTANLAQSPNALLRKDGAADTSEYRAMLQKLKAGEQVDLVKFRAVYLSWLNDECNVTDAPGRDKMVNAFEAKNYAKAVELAQPVLDYEYTNRGLHMALANAYQELGNTEKAKFHTNMAAEFLKAILASGDGKTAKTAYRVHGIREEYIVMRELGYQVSSQALVPDPQLGMFDVLSGKNAEGKEVALYFDIDDWWVGSTASKPCKGKKD